MQKSLTTLKYGIIIYKTYPMKELVKAISLKNRNTNQNKLLYFNILFFIITNITSYRNMR